MAWVIASAAGAGMTSFWPILSRVESTPGFALAIALQGTPNFLPMVENVSPLTTMYSRVAAGRASRVGCGTLWVARPVAGGAAVRSCDVGFVGGAAALVG